MDEKRTIELSNERGSFEKFFSGFALWRGRAFGKLLYIAVIFILLMAAYHWLFAEPRPSTRIETVQTLIQQPENRKTIFLGIKIYRVGFGIYVE